MIPKVTDKAQRVKVTFPRLHSQEAAKLKQRSSGLPPPTDMSGKLRAGSRRPYQGLLPSDSNRGGRRHRGRTEHYYYPLGFRRRLTLAGYFPGNKDFDPYIEESVTRGNAVL